jgi:hypothetical protein
MSSQKSIGIKFTLLGLTVAFLYSALVIPVSGIDLQKTQDSNLTLNQAGNHTSPNAPLPLPGEEKEEETRGEKDSKFILAFICSSVEFSQILRVEHVKKRWLHSSLAPAQSTPLYLLKHSLLI